MHLGDDRDAWTGGLRFEPGRLVGELKNHRDGRRLRVVGDIATWSARRKHVSGPSAAGVIGRLPYIGNTVHLEPPVAVEGIAAFSLGKRYSLRCMFRNGTMVQAVVTYPDGRSTRVNLSADDLFSALSKAIRDQT